MDEELRLIDQQGKWFLEMECTLGEDAVESVEMTTKGLEYYIHLVDNGSNFERISTVGNMLLKK